MGLGTAAITRVTENVGQVALITIDWNEVILLAIGAVIGLVASLATIGIQRFLDQKGSLNIFYRFINRGGATTHGWGFNKSSDGYLYLSIPVVFELQNTSNVTRVIRDVSLLLYNDNKVVDKMVQIDHMHTTTRRDGVVTKEDEHYFGTEKGSYSFVLNPRSIQKQECRYTYKIHPSEREAKMFNKIIARYYDEKNKPHMFVVKNISDSWQVKSFDPDEDWVLLGNRIM